MNACNIVHSHRISGFDVTCLRLSSFLHTLSQGPPFPSVSLSLSVALYVFLVFTLCHDFFSVALCLSYFTPTPQSTAGDYDQANTRETLENLVSLHDIVVFSATYCPFSLAAKRTLAAQGVPFQVPEGVPCLTIQFCQIGLPIQYTDTA